ncbi:MAG: hypothetical protein COB34_05600, partial [Methylophilaceae bacterium]
MVNTVRVDVVSAEEEIFSGDAEFIVAPASAGEVGVFPHHAPMITTIKPGALRIKLPDTAEETLIFISGGMLEVQPGLVTVLADTAIRGADLDEAKAIAVCASADFGIPVFDLDSLDLEMAATKLVGEKLIRKHHSLPLYKRGQRLYVAVSDPTNFQGLDEIKFNVGLSTEAILVEED